MYDKAKAHYEMQKEQLRYLVSLYRPLMIQVVERTPSFHEMGSLASMLHSFYTGIENTLDRISREIDGHRLRSDMWHRELLDGMAAPTANRAAVITQETRGRLHEYLRFRHFYRNAYTFTLDWERMAPLVARAAETLERLEAELDAFFARYEVGEQT